MELLGIPGTSYKRGRCECRASVRVNRKAGRTECPGCGQVYDNLTGLPATAWLLAELGHTGDSNQ
jgi:hypothetical protein